jgi:RNA polymerase sigma-70 factor, ECF subfamily
MGFFALILQEPIGLYYDIDGQSQKYLEQLQAMTDQLHNLIQSAIDGDLTSFGQLASRYYPAMVSIAYAVCRDHHAAEDAAQEALAQAMVSLSKLRHPDRFGPWLCRICRNVASDMSSRCTWFPRPHLSPDEDAGPDVDLKADIDRAMAALPGHARQLLVLKYYNDLSYDQIQQTLGLSKAAVNGRLTRAKRKLAACLKKYGYPEVRL